jgi:hypothetical protein
LNYYYYYYFKGESVWGGERGEGGFYAVGFRRSKRRQTDRKGKGMRAEGR